MMTTVDHFCRRIRPARPGAFLAAGVVGLALLSGLAQDAAAGANLGARALLSFSRDSVVTAPPATLPALTRIFVWFDGLKELKGAEYGLRWYVEGGADSLLTIVGEKHPSGFQCGEFLLRGHSIGVPLTSAPNEWGISFASDEAETTCGRGPVSEVLFDASALAGRKVTISLCHARVLDAASQEDDIVPRGELRLNGGATPVPCAGPRLSGVSPRAVGSKGATVIMSGEGFTPGMRAFVAGQEAERVQVLDGHHLSAFLPAHTPGVFAARVVASEGLSGWLTQGIVYSDEPSPAIQQVLPDSVGIGSLVTVRGEGFTAGTRVRIGGLLSPHVHVVSARLLTAEVPMRRAGQASLMLENPDGQTVVWPRTIYLLADASR